MGVLVSRWSWSRFLRGFLVGSLVDGWLGSWFSREVFIFFFSVI